MCFKDRNYINCLLYNLKTSLFPLKYNYLQIIHKVLISSISIWHFTLDFEIKQTLKHCNDLLMICRVKVLPVLIHCKCFKSDFFSQFQANITQISRNIIQKAVRTAVKSDFMKNHENLSDTTTTMFHFLKKLLD